MTILTHTQKLEKFRNDLELKIKRRVGKQTRFSKHKHDKAIILSKECRFYLDGSRWLEELTTTKLVDCNGYTYDYSVLTLEQLCEIGDEIFYINLSKK